MLKLKVMDEYCLNVQSSSNNSNRSRRGGREKHFERADSYDKQAGIVMYYRYVK